MRAAKIFTLLTQGFHRVRPLLPALTAGFCLGLSAVVWLTQMSAILGVGVGVRFGLGLGCLAGLGWGCQLYRRQPDVRWTGPLLSLAGLLVIWPMWANLLLDLPQLAPLSAWNQTGFTELCGAILGIGVSVVPCAVATLFTCVATRADSLRAAVPRQALLLGCGSVSGILLSMLVLAPSWGVYWPALVSFAVLAGILRLEAPVLPPSDSAKADAGSPAHLSILLLVGVCGLQFHAVWGLLSQMSPSTLPHWCAAAAVLIAGWCLGICCPRWARQRVEDSPAALLTTLFVIGAGQLSLAAGLIDLSLWLSSRLLNPVTLELARIGVMGALLVPLGVWLGILSSPRADAPAPLASPLRPGLALSILVAGLLGGELLSNFLPDPQSQLWLMVVVTGLGSLIASVAATRAWNRRATYRMTGVAAVMAGLVCISPVTWPTERSVKLLFSTPALLGARSAVPSELLTQLDDSRLVARADGPEGQWTAWKTHGADLMLRQQGVPRGAITTRPDWSPQFAPEVAAAIWPLALVDQPARVLLLGAGSSASLQAALAFPIKEVVCCEADDALLSLLREHVATAGSYNPFADDRCRMLRQPPAWMALPAAERFDVIVSAPAPAILPEATASLTVEFYRRAAGRLSAQGVFCQRFSSVDFGPKPLLCAAMSLQQAFPSSACLEVGPGEFLLLGAHSAESLVRPDLPRRLEMPHVTHVLSRCNWDWSLPLNLPAYDQGALQEAAKELGVTAQTGTTTWTPFFTPHDLLRWGPKLQETAALLAKPRSTAAVFPLPQEDGAPRELQTHASRKSRYLEWLGPAAENPELLRRLAEATSQHQLVLRYPDTHWWEYRKELRHQLQDHPRTAIQTVSHSSDRSPGRWHPEDRRRKQYFEALGVALKAETPSPAHLASVESLLEPFDPLLTLFAHQELADLYARARLDPLRESEHRLHVIYYSPSGDASVRNVVTAIDHLVANPAAAPSDADRFERLNGLLQTLRTRWELRNNRPAKSARVTQQEIERSLISVERALDTMQPLAVTAGFTEEEWQVRRNVLERILIRPFRSYRDQLVVHTRESERRTRELLDRSTEIPSVEAGVSAGDSQSAAATAPATLP